MKGNNNKDFPLGGKVAIIAAFVIFAVVFIWANSGGSSSSGKRRYSDLSDTEKANAKWAYEMKQYIDSMD